MKRKPEDLEEFIMVESSIDCSNCKSGEIFFMGDEMYAAKEFFKKGWRATKDNVYCPKCAKKKLKK